MKILMVSGPVHYTYSLCRALGEAGATVRLLAPPVFDMDGYPCPFEIRRPFAGRGYLGGLRALAGEARAFQPDLIHFQWTFAPRLDWLAATALARLGAPAVLTVHNVAPHAPALGEAWALARLYRRFRGCLVHAERVAAQLESFGVPRARIAVIPHGNFDFVREKHGMPPPGEARRRLGLPVDAPVALFFGGLRLYKGLGVLLDAFDRVRTALPEARLVLAGYAAGPEGELCLREIRSRALGESVLFRPGYVADGDIPFYFSAADLVVLPYTTGTYSGVIHLAYSFGNPIVTTDVGAVGDTVRGDGSGLVVKPGDPAALAGALTDLLRDPSARAACAVRIEAAARDKYGWDRVARQTLDWYGAVARG